MKDILSISGKSGLFKLISSSKTLIIAESLTDGKRIPIYPREKVIALGSIAIYTEEAEVSLGEVFQSMFAKEEGKAVEISSSIDNETLRSYLGEVLPNFDRDRVYPSDIRKLIIWYNILIGAGFTEFVDKEEQAEDVEA